MPKKPASSKLSPVLRNLRETELSAALAALAEAKKTRQDEEAAVRAAILQRITPSAAEGQQSRGAAASGGVLQRGTGGGTGGAQERGGLRGGGSVVKGWGEEDEEFIRSAAAEDEAVLSPEALLAESRPMSASVTSSTMGGDLFGGMEDVTMTPTVVATPIQPTGSRAKFTKGISVAEGGSGGGLLRELEDALSEAERWKGQAERLRAKLISDRRTFSEATRRLERQAADSKADLDKNKLAADKASQNIVKLREEANKHREVLTKHVKAEQSAKDEVIQLKQKLAEHKKKIDMDERRNAAAQKREQTSKDATNRMWARDRDELDKCKARIAELEVADRRQTEKLSEYNAEISRLISMLPAVSSPLRTLDTSIQTTPPYAPPTISSSPTIQADHYDHTTGKPISASIPSNASLLGGDAPSASFTDTSLASKVLSSSRQIALLRNRRDMAALVSHLRGNRTSSPAPSISSDLASTPLVAGSGSADPRSPNTPAYALGPLPATPSWPSKGVGGSASNMPVEGLAIRFALRLNIGIGVLRDESDDYGEKIRSQVASAAGIASNRVLLHGVHAGGGVVDLTVRPAPAPPSQNPNLTMRTPTKATAPSGNATPANKTPGTGARGGVRTALETVANLSAQIGVPNSGLMKGEQTKAVVSLEILSAYHEVGTDMDETIARMLEGGFGGLVSEDVVEQMKEAGRLRKEAEAQIESLTVKLADMEGKHSEDLAKEKERVVKAISEGLERHGEVLEVEGEELLGGSGGWAEEGEAGRVAVAAVVREWEGLRTEVEGSLGEAKNVATEGGMGGMGLYGAVRNLEGPGGVFVSEVGPKAMTMMGGELSKWRERAVAAASQVSKLRSQAEALRRQVVDAEEVAFAKLDAIEAEHGQKDGEINQLKSLLEACQGEVAGARMDRDAMQARLGVAGVMISSMETELRGVSGGIWEVVGGLGVEGESWSGKVGEAEGEAMVMGSRLRELEEILEGMQASMSKERKEWQVEREGERVERDKERVERQRQREEEQQAREREEQARREKWEQDKGLMESQKTALEEALAKANALAESERKERERLKEEKEEEAAKLLQTVVKTQENAERERERLEEEIVKERAEVEGHKSLLDGSTHRLQSELDQLRSMVEGLEEEKKALEEEREWQRETLEKREKAFSDALEKVMELEAELEGVSGKLEESEAREKELATKIEESQSEEEMGELQERLEGREKALNEALDKVIELEGALEEALANNKMLEGTQGEFERSQSELEETKKKLEKAHQDAANAQESDSQQVQEMREELEDARETLGGREKALAEALERVMELEESLQGAEEKAEQTQREAQQGNEESLEREREDAKVLLRDAQRGREEAQRALDEALRTLEARTKDVETLEGALQEAQQALEARGGDEEVWRGRAMALEEKEEAAKASASLMAHQSDMDEKALELQRFKTLVQMGAHDVMSQLGDALEEAVECLQGMEGGGGGADDGAMSDRELGRALDEALGQLEAERDKVAVLKMSVPDGGAPAPAREDVESKARLECAQREARVVLRALEALAEDFLEAMEGIAGDLSKKEKYEDHDHHDEWSGSGSRGGGSLKSALDELKAEKDMCEMQRAIIQELRDRTKKLESRLGGAADDDDDDDKSPNSRAKGADGEEDDDPDNQVVKSGHSSPGKLRSQSLMLSPKGGDAGGAGGRGEDAEMKQRVEELEGMCEDLETEAQALRQREGDLLQSVLEYESKIQEMAEKVEELEKSLEEARAGAMGEKEREEREREWEEEREVERGEAEEAAKKLQKRIAALEKDMKEKSEELEREREEHAMDIERSQAAVKAASVAAEQDIKRMGGGAALEEAERQHKRRSGAASVVAKRVFAATQIEDLFSCVIPMLRDILSADSCVLYLLIGEGRGVLRTLLSGDVLTAYAAQMMDTILSQGAGGDGPGRNNEGGGGGKEEVSHVMDVQLGGRGLLGAVVRGMEPILCEDGTADDRYDKEVDAAHFTRFVAEGLGGGELGSVMCAPLMRPREDGGVIGVLQVCRKKGGGRGPFGEYDLDVLADAGRVMGLKHESLEGELQAMRDRLEGQSKACKDGVEIAEALEDKVVELRSAAHGVSMLQNLEEMRDGLQQALDQCSPEEGQEGAAEERELGLAREKEKAARLQEEREREERRIQERQREDEEQLRVEQENRERAQKQELLEQERKAALQEQHEKQVKELQRQEQERKEQEREQQERQRQQEDEERRRQEDRMKEEEGRREEERRMHEEEMLSQRQLKQQQEEEEEQRLRQQEEEEREEEEEEEDEEDIRMRKQREEEALEAEKLEQEIREQIQRTRSEKSNERTQSAEWAEQEAARLREVEEAEEQARRQREEEEDARRREEEDEDLRQAAAAAVAAAPSDHGGGRAGGVSSLRVADRYRLDLLPPLDEQFEYAQQAIALFDYDAIEDDELTFKAGDTITLIGIAQPSWYFGDLRGKVGLLPSNYCQVLEE